MIHHGDLFTVLPTLLDASVDACVTDPPYGLGFMAKDWDVPGGIAGFPMRRRVETDAVNTGASRQGGRQRSCADFAKRQRRDAEAFEAEAERWAGEVFRVLKPGAYLLAFGGTRMYHRMTSGIENAGFEIRDCLSWLYGSGFPKSLNLPGGLGTALKPSWEPIILARKPTIGTVAANVERFGTAALNIDACRIGDGADKIDGGCAGVSRLHGGGISARAGVDFSLGRWPANVVLDEAAAVLLDKQSGELVSGPESDRGHRRNADAEAQRNSYGGFQGQTATGVLYGDRGGASRFYYVAKPSQEERNFGCDGLPQGPSYMVANGSKTSALDGARYDRKTLTRNSHPTVKPVELMRWLVKLVTPIGGTVLDPFTGSGTTGMACRYEQREFIGIEREAEYVAIAERRIAAVAPLFHSDAAGDDTPAVLPSSGGLFAESITETDGQP